MDNLGYQRIPGLKPYTRMRTAREYSNLPPLYKSLWNEYRSLRMRKAKLEDIRRDLPPSKPRYKLVNGRPKPVVAIDQTHLNYVDLFKVTQRLHEIALYFWNGLRWIAPDYEREGLETEVEDRT